MFNLFLVSICLCRQPPTDGKWWYDSRIHNFGNTGHMGKVHAHIASHATKLIDILAYNGRNVRDELLANIPYNSKVCDMGCGVGLSTTDNERSIGIDSSNEMIDVAMKECMHKKCKFEKGNAVSYGFPNEFEYATIFYLLHEAPEIGRINVINNAMRISSKGVMIVDIHTDYKPSCSMLSGEPYVIDYLSNIDTNIEHCCKVNNWYIKELYTYIEGHIKVWSLRPYW